MLEEVEWKHVPQDLKTYLRECFGHIGCTWNEEGFNANRRVEKGENRVTSLHICRTFSKRILCCPASCQRNSAFQEGVHMAVATSSHCRFDFLGRGGVF